MLNWDKPYGEVFGDSTHKYEQDDKLFNVHGQEVNEKGDVIEKNVEKEIPKFGKK